MRSWLVVLVSLSVLTVSCSETSPTPEPRITLSSERVLDRGRVVMKGTGFTPKTDVGSHLKRPNGTEFPILHIITDAKGEFTHDINTLEMQIGTHEVWVEESAGVSSNVAKFEVVAGEAPAK